MPMFYTEKGFLKAVAKGDVELVDKYFAHGGKEKWLALRGPNHSSPLHIAAENGNGDLIKKFIDAGMSIEDADGDNCTPLGRAVMNRSLTAMYQLIDAGADVNAKTPYGSLLQTTIAFYFEAGFKLLLEKKADPNIGNPVAEAMQHNYKDMIKDLLAAGAAPEKHGLAQELFHSAMQGSNKEIAKLMLERGADINGTKNDGETALHIAVMYDKRDMVAFLLENGARTDVRNNSDATPSQVAVSYGRNSIAKLLETEQEKHLAKTATPLNAGMNRMPDDSAETWVLMGENQVARVGIYPAIARRLTHIFNFESRERLIITENLKTGAESVTNAEKFDTLEEAHLAKAVAAFRELGGKVDDSAITNRMGKKNLPQPGV